MKRKIKEAINFLSKTNDLNLIKDKLITYHPADLSIFFENFDFDLRQKVYSTLDDHELALLFSYLDDPIQYLNELEVERVSSLLENMEVDDASNILEEIFDEDLKEAYLANLNKDLKFKLDYISKIKEDKVGHYISTNYISVPAGIDVKEAMKILIKDADESELLDPIFVTANSKLAGIIKLNDLIIARSPKIIDELIQEKTISININEPITNAVNMIRNYSLNALPVTDNENLVGIITSDDAFEISSEQADTKYANLAGFSSDDLGDKRFFKRLLERLPWLIGLLALSLITTNIMGIFEGVIKQVAILVFFQTLIFDMAGNVGTQSLAVTIQTLIRNNNLSSKESRKHIFKEIKINLINAFFLMIIAFIVCYSFISLYGTDYSKVMIAFTISISMGITLVISSLFGAMLPILLTKIKLNPAVASGPLITTINDILAIVIYFSLAALLLNLSF